MNNQDKNMNQKSKFQKYYDRVCNYILLEYNEDLITQMNKPKYKNIIVPFIKNCFSLNKTIPDTSHGVVNYLRKTT